MADIAKTIAQIGLVDPTKAKTLSVIAAEAIDAGEGCYINSAGKAALADGSAAGTAQIRGVALNSAGAGQAVTLVKEGAMYGFTISGMDYDARAYVSDTAGALADAAGTVPATVGRVIGLSDKDITKVLYVDTDWTSQWA